LCFIKEWKKSKIISLELMESLEQITSIFE